MSMVLSPDRKALDLRKAAGLAPPETDGDTADDSDESDDVDTEDHADETVDVSEQAAP
jgi:hypothetical protein